MYVVNPDSLAIVTIFQEAAGEPLEGKVAVGEVIRNRMARKYSSDGTVAGTVCRRYQFSAWNDDPQGNDLLIRSLKIRDEDQTVKDCVRAWEISRDSDFAKAAVLYCNLAVLPQRPSWARDDKRVAVIGNHTFFKD